MFRTPLARTWSRVRQLNVWLGSLLVLAIGVPEATAVDQARSPSRLIPARGLTAYVEFDGFGAHDAAWKATAVYAVLYKTPAGSMVLDMLRHVLTPDQATAAGRAASTEDLLAFGEDIVRNGFTSAYFEDENGSSNVIVFNGFGESIPRPVRANRSANAFEPGASECASTPTKFRGRDVYQLNNQVVAVNAPGGEAPTPWTWWFEADDLILVPWPGGGLDTGLLKILAQKKGMADVQRTRVTSVLDTIEGKQPNLSTQAGYAAARAEGQDLGGFEPIGLCLFESTSPLGKGLISDMRDRLKRLCRGSNE